MQQSPEKGLAHQLNIHGFGFQYTVIKAAQLCFDQKKSPWIFEVAEFPVEYCYKVTAVYESEEDYCESDFAFDADEMYDYVCVLITDTDDPLALTTNLYPNPARDQVTISSSEVINRITIINYVGQLVEDSEMNQHKTILNTSNYESGVYVVRIETENGVVTKRFAIAR